MIVMGFHKKRDHYASSSSSSSALLSINRWFTVGVTVRDGLHEVFVY